MCILSDLIMSGICVECWRAQCVIPWQLHCVLDSLTFQALFESIQLSSVGNCGHSVMLTVSVLPSVKGEWTRVQLDADVSLSTSFGCCNIQFNLPNVSSSEPVPKYPSAFNVLLENVARCNELPAWKAKIISLEIFSFRLTQSFLGSRVETQNIFGLALAQV